MSKSIPFVKYSGNGNDFIILRGSPLTLNAKLIEEMCHRTMGIGADGVLVLSLEAGADGRMRIYNSDGGEAEMCANGLRCLVTYLDSYIVPKKNSYDILTMNACYQVSKMGDRFAIEMSEIKDHGLYDFSSLHPYEKSFFVNTGVPHLVFLVNDAKVIDIRKAAPPFRHHKVLPTGANVSFIEVLDRDVQSAYVRTFERGVEDETYSCGTGLTATGVALLNWFGWKNDITLFTKGGEQKVQITDKVMYSGDVKFCFQGEWPLER
jgi:diaminopimelate epimerase